MAIKYANKKYLPYQVYDHQPPVFTGKDKMGDDQYRANLVPIGLVMAKSKEDAWQKAHELCSLPVLEIINHVH